MKPRTQPSAVASRTWVRRSLSCPTNMKMLPAIAAATTNAEMIAVTGSPHLSGCRGETAK
jgi:hypothetical protein